MVEKMGRGYYRMAENKTSIWTSGLAINLVSNAIAFTVGGIVTYLSHDGSAWVKPLLCGAGAWLLTFCSILAFRISKNLPVKNRPMDATNVQQRIRDWVDKFNMTVKSVKDEESHFFFIVTTDGGKKVSISRRKDQFSDYILVKGLISASAEEKTVLDAFTDDEKIAARLAITLELSRAVMGYKSDHDVLESITVFKRIPITHSLHEENIFSLVWEVEAMLGSIFIVGAMAAHRHRVKAQSIGQS
jgi:hypothetical protein